MLRNPDVEATFTVHEPYNPSRLKLHWPAPDVLVSEGSRGSRESSLRIVPLKVTTTLHGMPVLRISLLHASRIILLIPVSYTHLTLPTTPYV